MIIHVEELSSVLRAQGEKQQAWKIEVKTHPAAFFESMTESKTIPSASCHDVNELLAQYTVRKNILYPTFCAVNHFIS